MEDNNNYYNLMDDDDMSPPQAASQSKARLLLCEPQKDSGNCLESANVSLISSEGEKQAFSHAPEAQKLPINIPFTTLLERQFAMLFMLLLSTSQDRQKAFTQRYTVNVKNPQINTTHNLENHQLQTFMRDLPTEIKKFDRWDYRPHQKKSFTQKISAPCHGLSTIFIGFSYVACASLTPTLLAFLNEKDPIQQHALLTPPGAFAFLSPIPLPLRLQTWPNNMPFYFLDTAVIIPTLFLGSHLLKKYHAIMPYQHKTPYRKTGRIVNALMHMHFMLRTTTPIVGMNLGMITLQAIHHSMSLSARIFLGYIAGAFLLFTCLATLVYLQHSISGYYPSTFALTSLLLSIIILPETGLFTDNFLYYGQWALGIIIALCTFAYQHERHCAEEPDDNPVINKAMLFKTGMSMLMRTLYHTITTAFISVTAYQALICQNNANCQNPYATWGLKILSAIGSAAYVYITRAQFISTDHASDDDHGYDTLSDDDFETAPTPPTPTSHGHARRKTILYSLLKWGLALGALELYGGFDFHATHNPFKKWYHTLMPILMVLSHGFEIPHMWTLDTQAFGDHLQRLSLWLIAPLVVSAAFGLFDPRNDTHNPITPTYLAVFSVSVIASYALEFAWIKTNALSDQNIKKHIYKALEAKYNEVENTVGFKQPYAVLKAQIDNTAQTARDNTTSVLYYREMHKTNLKAVRELHALTAYYKLYDPECRLIKQNVIAHSDTESRLAQADSHTRTVIKFTLAVFTLLLSPGLLAQHLDNVGYKGCVMLSLPMAMFMYKMLYDQLHTASLMSMSQYEDYEESHDLQTAIRKKGSHYTLCKSRLSTLWQHCMTREHLIQEEDKDLEDPSYVLMQDLSHANGGLTLTLVHPTCLQAEY